MSFWESCLFLFPCGNSNSNQLLQFSLHQKEIILSTKSRDMSTPKLFLGTILLLCFFAHKGKASSNSTWTCKAYGRVSECRAELNHYHIFQLTFASAHSGCIPIEEKILCGNFLLKSTRLADSLERGGLSSPLFFLEGYCPADEFHVSDGLCGSVVNEEDCVLGCYQNV